MASDRANRVRRRCHLRVSTMIKPAKAGSEQSSEYHAIDGDPPPAVLHLVQKEYRRLMNARREADAIDSMLPTGSKESDRG